MSGNVAGKGLRPADFADYDIALDTVIRKGQRKDQRGQRDLCEHVSRCEKIVLDAVVARSEKARFMACHGDAVICKAVVKYQCRPVPGEAVRVIERLLAAKAPVTTT